jgi:hypothetical protein
MTPYATSILAPFALRRGAPVLLDGKVVCSVFERAFSGGWYLMGGTGGSYDGARLALDCLDPLGRLCLRMALAEGEPVPAMWLCPMAHDADLMAALYTAPGACPRCSTPMVRATDALAEAGRKAAGIPRRTPVAAHWIGGPIEGGALTQAHADAAGMSLDELAASLLVRCAEMAVAGRVLVGLVYSASRERSEAWLAGHGTVHWTAREDRDARANGYARLGDADGRSCLQLPEVS